MSDIFTFANSQQGHEQRDSLADVYASNGITTRAFEETWTDGNQTTHVLRLEVTGKRASEGLIAADMKRRKA